MPRRPKRPCNHPGCNTLTEGGNCDQHKRRYDRRYEDKRAGSSARGYTNRWRRYATAYLSIHPLCAECSRADVDTPAVLIHHIVPIDGGDDPLFWKESNHEGLCFDCHEVKHERKRRGPRV